MFDILGVHFREFDSRRHFPPYYSFLLSVLALVPTVILRVYSYLDLGPETGRLQVNCFSFFVRMLVIDR